jgi:hypothetical protein
MVTFELPLFVTVTDFVTLDPMLTLPKLRLVGFSVSSGVGELTVSVAVPLVTLPAELLTDTLNCAPLSALVVAGVV